MMKRKLGYRISCALVLTSLMMLAGCGSGYEQADVNLGSLTILKDGSVDAVLIDDFSDGKYNESELAEYINKELLNYNASHGVESINMKNHTRRDESMVVELHFTTVKDYDEYMPYKLFTGTVQEAYDKGYDFDCALSFAQQPEHVIGKNDLMNMADKKILIFTGHGRISLPSKIKYYTQSMKQTSDRSVEASEDGPYIIIY